MVEFKFYWHNVLTIMLMVIKRRMAWTLRRVLSGASAPPVSTLNSSLNSDLNSGRRTRCRPEQWQQLGELYEASGVAKLPAVTQVCCAIV